MKQSLDAFLYSNTSEDNASFGVMVAEAERRHREKHSWMYRDEKELGAPLQKMLEGKEDSGDDKAALGAPKDSQALVMWKYTNRNSLMYIPHGVPLTVEEKRERGPGRVIAHAQTRLERPPFDESLNREALAQAADHQAKSLAGKLGVDGRELQGSASPQVGGFGFVATPSPAPGDERTFCCLTRGRMVRVILGGLWGRLDAKSQSALLCLAGSFEPRNRETEDAFVSFTTRYGSSILSIASAQAILPRLGACEMYCCN